MSVIKHIYNIYRTNYSLTTDSRNVEPGMVYLALKGDRFDGNVFAEQALEKGASLVVIDDENCYKDDGQMILVEDGLKALQDLAKYHRKELNLPVIALTGSNGKTTTKELISVALSTKYAIHVTAGNYNNHIGVPLTILGATPDHELMILEMGANHQGEIAELCAIGMPDIGLITNIGKAHLEGFGGYEGVIKGKSEMYHFLKERGGTILFNEDDSLLSKLVNGYNPSIGYSPSNDFEIVTSHPSLSYIYDGQLFNTHLVGNYNMANIATAIAVGHLMECDTHDMLKAISTYTPTNNRSQSYVKNGIHFILDAYNANPSSMHLAIDAFAKADYSSKVLVLGDMLELGDESKVEHIKILTTLKKYNWQEVYLIGDHFGDLQDDFMEYHFHNSVDALEPILKSLEANVTVFVKGSRATQLEKVVQFID